MGRRASHDAGPAAQLWRATAALHAAGLPLMARVLPSGAPIEAWRHYPARDVVNGAAQARWFYHSHGPDEGDGGEHGHFHLSVGRAAFGRAMRPLIAPPDGRRPRPSTVQIAALAIGLDGVPLRWFATNRWVTDEWLYPADAIAARIPGLSFAGAAGDPLVNDWLIAMLRASYAPVAAMLAVRDAALCARDPAGEDRRIEVLASAPVDLDALLDG